MIEALIGSVLTAIAGSEGAKAAGKEFSQAVWATVKPYLIEEEEAEVPEMTQAVEAVRAAAPTPPAAEERVREKLREALTGEPDRIEKVQEALRKYDQAVNLYRQRAKNIVNNPNISGDLNMS